MHCTYAFFTYIVYIVLDRGATGGAQRPQRPTHSICASQQERHAHNSADFPIRNRTVAKGELGRGIHSLDWSARAPRGPVVRGDRQQPRACLGHRVHVHTQAPAPANVCATTERARKSERDRGRQRGGYPLALRVGLGSSMTGSRVGKRKLVLGAVTRARRC